MSDQNPSGSAGRCGADGWMKDLPKKKARPVPNSIMRDADRDVVDLGKLADPAVEQAEAGAGAAAASRPSHGEPVMTATA